MQHPELGGQSVEPSQEDTDTGMREGTGNELAASHDLDGSPPASVLDEPEPHVAAAPAQLSARARGKKRAREPSTSLMLEAQGELGVEADELASRFEGHKGGDDSASLGLDGSGEVDQSLGQPHLETPVKVRKENTGRGNSGKSAKGYLYYQGRNETGRKSCTGFLLQCRSGSRPLTISRFFIIRATRGGYVPLAGDGEVRWRKDGTSRCAPKIEPDASAERAELPRRCGPRSLASMGLRARSTRSLPIARGQSLRRHVYSCPSLTRSPTSVSCKDRARNLKTIMMRQNTEAPSTFNNITVCPL